MKKANTLLATFLMLSLLGSTPHSLPPVFGATGTVCIADFSTDPANCPTTPATLNGSAGSSLVVAVNVQDADSLNGFDIFVHTDPSVLQPTSTDLTGIVFPQANLFVVVNSVDAAAGLVRVAAVATAFFTTAPTTGRFFSITYNIVANGGTAISFPTGCAGSSNDSFCVTITNPNLPNGVVPVNLQTATFGSPNPDFTITASPASQFVTQGTSASSTIFLASLNGFSGTVDLSTSPACLALTCPGWGIDPTSIGLASGGSGMATLSFSTTPVTATGPWVVTVSAVSGSLSHSVDVTFTVVAPPPPPPPDFTISASPSSQNIFPGETATYDVTVASVSSFAGDVSLTPIISPSGPVASIVPTVVTLSSGGSALAKLTVVTSMLTTLGSYQVVVVGTSGSLSHSATVTLNVITPPLVGIVCIAPGDSTSCPPSPVVLQAGLGSQLVVAVNVQDSEALNGFDIQVQADPSVLQPASASTAGTLLANPFIILNQVDSAMGLTRVAAVSQGAITTPPTTGRFFSITYKVVGPSPGSTIGFSFVIVTNPNFPGGTVPENLQAATVNVQPPDFSINASPTSLSVRPGQTATSTITLSSLSRFSGDISLSTSITPLIRRGPSVSLSPAVVTLAQGGSGTSILTVTAPRSVIPGTYTIVVTATSGSLTHTITLTLTVLPRR